jgi:hypothetical protein
MKKTEEKKPKKEKNRIKENEAFDELIQRKESERRREKPKKSEKIGVYPKKDRSVQNPLRKRKSGGDQNDLE